MLKETERAKGGQPYQKHSTPTDLVGVEPTLERLGLDYKTSKLAQDIASLPDEQIERVKEGVASLHQAQKEVQARQRNEARAELANQGAQVPQDSRWNVGIADVR